jgi:hypothetical protein
MKMTIVNDLLAAWISTNKTNSGLWVLHGKEFLSLEPLAK